MTASPFAAKPYPVVRLKPKADATALMRGALWVYSDELVTDRRTKALSPGAIAVLENASREPLGLVTVNTNSKIIARILDRDPEASIDANWLSARITRALSLRDRIYDAPFYRLIHAEADGFPGVIVDRFGDTLVLQPNAAWAENLIGPLADLLLEHTGARNLLKNASGRARVLEGLDEQSDIIHGEVSGSISVAMNGATYLADLQGGQKTGLFYDQRDNHAFAAKFAKDAEVLDVFSHVGGFALAALASGARSALAVEGSQSALNLAEQGAEMSGTAERFSTRKGDAFKVMEALLEEQASFDLVIADPPAFAPNKKALNNGLTAYSRVAASAARLVRPGGYLVLCSCSHAVDLTKFRQASLRGIARADRTAQLLHIGAAGPDHPMHPQLAESGYLKALFMRLD